MARPKRPLSSEERALWKHVTQHIKPLNEDSPEAAETANPAASTVAEGIRLATPDEAKALKPKSITGPAKASPPRRSPVRSALPAQARLDLHGMTQDEAHRALVQFIMMSMALGFRRVLIITGKGKPAESVAKSHPSEGRGILRRLVPLWLEVESLRPFIAGVMSAPMTLGGPGALIVDLNPRAAKER